MWKQSVLMHFFLIMRFRFVKYIVWSKDQLEKLLVRNRISFFIEWQERRLWQRFLGSPGTGKNVFTIRINEADSMLAKDLVEGMEYVEVGTG